MARSAAASKVGLVKTAYPPPQIFASLIPTPWWSPADRQRRSPSVARSIAGVFSAFYGAGNVTAALCHETAVLRCATVSNRELSARGRTVTRVANVAEDFANKAVWYLNMLARDYHVIPMLIADELKIGGAHSIQAGLWRGFAVRDGNLITGQRKVSGAETADLAIEALGG